MTKLFLLASLTYNLARQQEFLLNRKLLHFISRFLGCTDRRERRDRNLRSRMQTVIVVVVMDVIGNERVYGQAWTSAQTRSRTV